MAQAKDESAARIAKAVKLLEVANDLYEKMGDTLAEIDEILGGGAGMAAKLRTLQESFASAWGDRYARGDVKAYVWNHRVDVPNAKRLIKQIGLVELIDRVPRFMRDDYEPLARARHPFGWFVKQINSYAKPATAPAADLELDGGSPAVDCRHSPPCRSDQEHTRRKMAETRGGGTAAAASASATNGR